MRNVKKWLFCLCSISLLSACQVINMVGVKQVDFSKNANDERHNILTNDQLSQSSQNTLLLVNPKSQQCINSPAQCMSELQKIKQLSDEEILSTGSELYLSHALALRSDPQCTNVPRSLIQNNQFDFSKANPDCLTDYVNSLNQSIRYSYAYLFATQRQARQRLFNNRQIQVQDFYNQAVAQMMSLNNIIDRQQLSNNKIQIGDSQYQIDTHQYPDLDLKNIEQLISTYQLKFIGLNSLSKRDGFGSEFVIKLKTDENKKPVFVNYAKEKVDIFHHPNIQSAQYLPATVVIEPKDKNNIDAILNSKQMLLRTINPNQFDKINIHGQDYQLAANFSAPYGLWLANAKLGSQALNTLVVENKQFISPQLFMLEPYNPNKKLIIMVHGLASSPEAWIAVSNDLMGDAVLREQYQVWQVFYSTNMPILENRYQIYHLLNQALNQVQQQYPQQKISDTVLIGHSMGGIISRLLVSKDNLSQQARSYIQQECHTCHSDGIKVDKLIRDFQPQLQMQALPSVSRTVFISAPLRGTEFADRWFTQMARRIIKLPSKILTVQQNRLAYYMTDPSQEKIVKQLSQKLYQNGPSDLSPKSAFMYITQNINIINGMKYHVMTGNNTKSDDKDKITDGIVPYKSLHLDGALSEKIIPGSHSIQYAPEAVLELRRILHLHLDEIGKK
ncbi:lipase family alpha/beta hydrolase [Acinetobacter sp. c3-l95]|uniref:lipase family alpha/beta hydrolase n=1 Tax=Acinetobacter sp. c3-l95 TaxID=3342804 RepID=UPI0035BA156D